jgi:hypothetical protein
MSMGAARAAQSEPEIFVKNPKPAAPGERKIMADARHCEPSVPAACTRYRENLVDNGVLPS